MPIRRSTRGRRNAISNYFIVFFQEHENGIGLIEENPISFHLAMQSHNSKKWIDIMNGNMKFMKDNDIWELVPLAEDTKSFDCKWIFKTKKYSKSNVERYRLNLLKRLYSKRMRDYKETFSPVST